MVEILTPLGLAVLAITQILTSRRLSRAQDRIAALEGR